MNRPVRLLSFLAVVGSSPFLWPVVHAGAQTPSFQVILKTSDAAPGIPEHDISFLSGATINNSGQLAIFGVATNPNTTTSVGSLWRWTKGAFELLEMTGEPAPGTADAEFFEINLPNIADNGAIAFSGGLTGPGVTSTSTFGQWVYREGEAGQLVVRQGDPYPTFPGEVITAVPTGSPVMNTSGEILVDIAISNGEAALAEFLESGLSEIVDSTATTPGIKMGSFFPGLFSLSLSRQSYSPSRIFAFDSFFTSPVQGLSVAAWLRSSLIELLLAEEDLVPDIGVVEILAGSLRTNDTGEVITLIQADDGDPLTTHFALIGATPTTTRIIAENGDSAPGVPGATLQFDGISGEGYVFNANGHVAFTSRIDDGSGDVGRNEAMSTDVGGDLTMLLREGEPAPGSDGALWSADGSCIDGVIQNTPMITMNALDQIVFLGLLKGLGVNSTNDRGIWFANPGQGLRLVARTGQTIEITNGDQRVISGLTLAGSDAATSFGGFERAAGGEDGRPRTLNDQGQLVVHAFFDDGSAAILLFQLPSPCPEDIDGDGDVGSRDLALLLGCWGQNESEGCPINFDGDPVIGSRDLAILLGSWGPCQ